MIDKTIKNLENSLLRSSITVEERKLLNLIRINLEVKRIYKLIDTAIDSFFNNFSPVKYRELCEQYGTNPTIIFSEHGNKIKIFLVRYKDYKMSFNVTINVKGTEGGINITFTDNESAESIKESLREAIRRFSTRRTDLFKLPEIKESSKW